MTKPSKPALIEARYALSALHVRMLENMQREERSNDSFYTDGSRDALKKRLRDIAEAQVFINQLIKDDENG